jgi:hypothetical protein
VYEIGEGEHVIDLDRNLDAFPAWGRLVMSEGAVSQLCQLLGWDISPRKAATIAKQRHQIALLQTENNELRDALRGVLSAAELARLTVLLAEEPAVVDDEEEVEEVDPASIADADIIAVADEARDAGEPIFATVAEHFGISEEAAGTRVRRARGAQAAHAEHEE